MCVLTTIDTIWLNAVLPASPNWTSQISSEAVALPPRKLSDLAAPIYFVSIATKYMWLLEVAHVHTDDDRYDMVECSAAGQPKLDLSDQLRSCSVAST